MQSDCSTANTPKMHLYLFISQLTFSYLVEIDFHWLYIYLAAKNNHLRNILAESGGQVWLIGEDDYLKLGSGRSWKSFSILSQLGFL